MYVCVCKGVTCSAIRSAVSEQGIDNLRDLRRNLGVATQCGKCALSARRLLDETLAAATAGCCSGTEAAA